MELVLAILMGLGIFLVIPVIIGLSTVGIYMVNRHRAFNTVRTNLLKGTATDIETIAGEADHKPVSGSPAAEKSKSYVESK